MVSKNRSSLSLAFWNIDGLHCIIANDRTCKLNDTEIRSTFCKYDIIGLVETHCNSQDSLELPGYKIFTKIRDKSIRARRHYGGLAACVKIDIVKGVKVLQSDTSEILWLKLSKSFFNLKEDIFVAFVYVSPSSSAYAKRSDDIFELLEKDIASFSINGQCIICGDFNARTGSEADYVVGDISKYVDILENSDFVSDSPLLRLNIDNHSVDKHGKELLSLCKLANLRILNGRTLGDIPGNFTCYSHTGSPSVIDYILTSVNMLNMVNLFHVHDPSTSSIHCMLSCILSTGSYEPSCVKNDRTFPNSLRRFKWTSTSGYKFTKAINDPAITCKISNFLNQDKDVNDAALFITDVVTEVNQIAGIRRKSCINVGSRKKINNKKTKNVNHWFDADCSQKKKDLRNLAHKVRCNPFNTSCLNDFRIARKKFKSLINKKKTLFKHKLYSQMDELHNRNSREFWSLFNKLKGLDKNKSSENPISNKVWVEHFTSLLNDVPEKIESSFNDFMDDFICSHKNDTFNELNFMITSEEISLALSKLKNGKAAGIDCITNEMLKAGHSVLLPVLHKLFNKILSTGCFPDSWRCNLLQPLHKKGDKCNASNYRGIAIGSCVCKLFCSVLNTRLSNFSDKNNLVPKCQIGYKKGSRTSDHVLVLKSLIDRFVNKLSKSYLYCCFVDFKSAFDTISRRALIFKLLQSGIGGNFLSVLENIYSDVNYSIKVDNTFSDSISSRVGVKQGCVLSPLLFNLFLSDLPDIFDDCDPVALNDIKLSCLMFADDLIIVSTSSEGLQRALDKLSCYCKKWGLTVNLAKTKVLIFNKGGKLLKRFKFSFSGTPVECVDRYCYLGIIFSASGNFNAACDRLIDQASKAIFKLRSMNIRDSIITAYKLFNSLVLPILNYCSEVWCPFYLKGLNDTNFYKLCDFLPIEKVYLKFGKFLLGVGKRCTNAGVRGDLGQYPLLVTLLPNVLKYWLRVSSPDSPTIIHKTYIYMYQSMTTSNITSSNPCNNWSSCIKNMLCQFDLSDIWINHGTLYRNKMVTIFKSRLEHCYSEQWLKYINDSDNNPKLRTYKLFKKSFTTENYVLQASNVSLRRQFTKLRLSCHSLRVETGRHCHPKIPAEQRYCDICKSKTVEDEFHFIMSCPVYNNERTEFLNKLCSMSTIDTLSEFDKFLFIMGNSDDDINNEIFNYVNLIYDKRAIIGQNKSGTN